MTGPAPPFTGFDGEAVSLLRARFALNVPSHTHTEQEATLLLAGSMRDGEKVFRCGDLALADQQDDHHPRIVGQETCLCLVVLSGRRRFTGPFGRVPNLFAG